MIIVNTQQDLGTKTACNKTMIIGNTQQNLGTTTVYNKTMIIVTHNRI